MNDFFIKKYMIAKIMHIGIFIIIPLMLICMILGASSGIDFFLFFGMFLFVVAVPFLIVYVEKFHPAYKAYNYLKKHNLLFCLNDINPNVYSLPNSKISCGKYGFLVAKPTCIIPYSMVAWIYVMNVQALGIGTVDSKMMLHCRDGELFEIRTSVKEIPLLLNIIANNSLDLMIGHTSENQRKYAYIVRDFKNRVKR